MSDAPPTGEGTFRATSRVLLIDPSGAALMFLQYGKSHSVPPRWITPGGGVDPGESHDQAAIREVFEETGLRLESVPAAFLDEDFEPDQRWHPYQRGHWAWYDIRTKRFNPVQVQTSTVKKSVATISSQCWVRNSRHVVLRLRSGAGSMPFRFRMFATVPRARVCPRFDSAPMMRV